MPRKNRSTKHGCLDAHDRQDPSMRVALIVGSGTLITAAWAFLLGDLSLRVINAIF
jgi:hypothetical protein